MRRTKISCRLSEQEIDRAIKELKQYKLDFQKKLDQLRKRVAEELANAAQDGFNAAQVDDLLNGGSRPAAVSVHCTQERDNLSVVIASGEDAVFVEFGAGVYHNGSAGSSPHPKGSELGLTIGSYGEGHGKQSTWGYYQDGELHLTHGTPAVMPMYNAIKNVCDNMAQIVREVFG